MSLLTDFEATRDGDLVKKIEMALVSTAVDVQGENPATANHLARGKFAMLVLGDPAAYASNMAPAMTVNGSVTAASTDQQIKDRASAIWNSYCVVLT